MFFALEVFTFFELEAFALSVAEVFSLTFLLEVFVLAFFIEELATSFLLEVLPLLPFAFSSFFYSCPSLFPYFTLSLAISELASSVFLSSFIISCSLLSILTFSDCTVTLSWF